RTAGTGPPPRVGVAPLAGDRLPAAGADAAARLGGAGAEASRAGAPAVPAPRRGAAVRVAARMGAGRRSAAHRLEGHGAAPQGDHASVRGRAAAARAVGAGRGPSAD